MPTDIGPIVTPVYTATIPAPLDGEYANSAALQALVLPIANRVEYLRQGIESAPWREHAFLEDFAGPIMSVNGDHIVADGNWLANADLASGLMYANIPVVDADNSIGAVSFSNSGGNARDAQFQKSEGMFTVRNLRRIVCRVQLGTIAASNVFSIGAHFVGGTVAVRAVFDPAVSANWQLQTGGGAVNRDTGVPAAAGLWYVLDLEHDGVGGYTLSVDGSTPVAAIAGLPLISAPATVLCQIKSPSSGASRYVYMDYIYCRVLNTARV